MELWDEVIKGGANRPSCLSCLIVRVGKANWSKVSTLNLYTLSIRNIQIDVNRYTSISVLYLFSTVLTKDCPVWFCLRCGKINKSVKSLSPWTYEQHLVCHSQFQVKIPRKPFLPLTEAWSTKSEGEPEGSVYSHLHTWDFTKTHDTKHAVPQTSLKHFPQRNYGTVSMFPQHFVNICKNFRYNIQTKLTMKITWDIT